MKGYKFFKYLILNIFYYSLFYICSFIIPKNKKLILLGASFGKYFSGNPKYFYLHLINNKSKVDFDFYWVTSNKKIFCDLKQKKYPVLYFFSIQTFFYILRAKYLIIDNAARDISYIVHLNGRFNIIQTWHGIPMKNVFDKKPKSFFEKTLRFLVKKERELYKVILTCSEYDSKIYAIAMHNKNVRTIGYPRDDIFFSKDLSFVNYRQELNLYKYSKVFLYAPTFRDRQKSINPFSEKFLIQLNNYLKKNGYIFLIKNHPLFGNKFKISAFDNIQDVSNIVDDIQEILTYVDVLIVDYSSVFFDFSLSNKPIMFYIYDYKNYVEKCRDLYLNYSKDLPGPTVRDENELLDFIKSVDTWFRGEKYYKKYKEFNDRFHYYQDGKSCERLYTLIKNL